MDQTLSAQFTNMLYVCIFVPFLHPETPKPQSIPKDKPLKDDELPQAELITRVLNFRNGLSKSPRQASVPSIAEDMPTVKIKKRIVVQEARNRQADALRESTVVTKKTMTVYKP